MPASYLINLIIISLNIKLTICSFILLLTVEIELICLVAGSYRTTASLLNRYVTSLEKSQNAVMQIKK